MGEKRTRYLIRYVGEFVPETMVRADGSWLETADGRRVLDFTSGQICATIGHNHPRIVQSICRALGEVAHLNSRMLSPPVLALAEQLTALLPAPLEKALLLSTGGEANEAAFRMAKLHTGRFELVGLTRSWHGLNAGTSALTFAGGHRGYGPSVPGSHVLPAPYAYRCPVRHCHGSCDHTCLEVGFDILDQHSVGSLCAAVAEPVLSTGGIIVPPHGYFARLLELCRERGMLVILDEAQTGFGRLGEMFGLGLYDIVPDFVAVSKTLGGGLPISALITNAKIELDCYRKGFTQITSHVSDPLPAAAALAVLQVIEEEDLVRRSRERGEYLMARLRELQHGHEQIGDVRGVGLLCGMELVEDRDTKRPAGKLAKALSTECLLRGLSIDVARGRPDAASNCFRIAPPLTVDTEEIDLAVEILDQSLRSVLASKA